MPLNSISAIRLAGTDRLSFRLCKFIPELASVFTQNTADEVALLKALENAYCKSRYKMEFPIEMGTAKKMHQTLPAIRSIRDQKNQLDIGFTQRRNEILRSGRSE